MENKKDILCPTNCPYLAVRSFLPNTMPFYCTRYENFLGMNTAKRVQKCALCQGHQQDIIQTGLSLLDAQPSRIADLKQAFLQMKPADQRFLVDVLLKDGFQLHFTPLKKITSVILLTELLRLRHESRQKHTSAETQNFIKLLSIIGDTGTPMDNTTRTLLSNLFQVIDASEKAMLLSILENPANLKSFLNSFSKIPQDQSMLKNFRALLYDVNRQMQNDDNAHSLTHRIHLNHMMDMMMRARIRKQHQRNRD
ncbi:MAG: hypothetical protein E7021_01315 [Alphaproteobacteria bacterium]|nr:hypothetical protein [Alphaproteobacteria bacterium]